MASLKLSEQVAKLEKDFDYQYGYNFDLIKENSDLKFTIEYMTQEFKSKSNLVDKYKKIAIGWFASFALTWVLILSLAVGWILYCPAKPEVVSNYLEEIQCQMKLK